jgi:hypothetical membrane protein
MPGIFLTLVAASWLFILLAIPGTRKPAYSHPRHTISELGEIGAPQARLVAMGVFLPIGIVMLVVAWLVRGQETETGALALCLAVRYIAAALFPATPARPCPARGARPRTTWAGWSNTSAARSH